MKKAILFILMVAGSIIAKAQTGQLYIPPVVMNQHIQQLKADTPHNYLLKKQPQMQRNDLLKQLQQQAFLKQFGKVQPAPMPTLKLRSTDRMALIMPKDSVHYRMPVLKISGIAER